MKLISYTHRKEIVFPTGIIVPYNANGAAPSGWTLFSTPNGYYLSAYDTGGDLGYTVGAHAAQGIDMDYDMTTGVVDATGTIKYWTDSQGSHAGTHTNPGMVEMGAGVGGNQLYYNGPLETSQRRPDGEHKHRMTCTPTIGYDELQLIKATSNQYALPANSLLLMDSSSDFTTYGLSQPFGAGNTNLLKANTALANTATSYTLDEDESGGHDHNWNKDFYNAPLPDKYESTTPGAQSVIRNDNYSSYDHLHGVSSSTMTANMKRFYLSAWTNASTSFKGITKVIAMWEDPDNLPSGWVICDGNNGTKNLQKYFIVLRDKASGGLYAGDNTIAMAGSLVTNTWNHTHLKSASYTGAVESVWGVHGASGSAASHAHDLTFNYTTLASFLPAHYSLVFIQKT